VVEGEDIALVAFGHVHCVALFVVPADAAMSMDDWEARTMHDWDAL